MPRLLSAFTRRNWGNFASGWGKCPTSWVKWELGIGSIAQSALSFGGAHAQSMASRDGTQLAIHRLAWLIDLPTYSSFYCTLRYCPMANHFSRTERALAADKGWAGLVLGVLAAVLLLFWLLWFFAGQVTLYERSRSARVEVRQAPHGVHTPVAGQLLRVTAAVGQQVQAGDVLAELDASMEQARMQEEQARLLAVQPKLVALSKEVAAQDAAINANKNAADAALASLQARMREAKAGADFAREQERRLRAEAEAGGVAKADALKAAAEASKLAAGMEALDADTKRAGLDATAKNWQLLASVEGLRRSAAGLEGEKQASVATLERAQREAARKVLRAPVAGTVAELPAWSPGVYVTEGQKLATVVPAGELVVVAQFNAASALGRLQIGQPAQLRLDGFPWTQFGMAHATVRKVASETRDGTLRVEFSAAQTLAAGMALRHGMPGSVEVSVGQVSPAGLVWRLFGQTALENPAASTSGPV